VARNKIIISLLLCHLALLGFAQEEKQKKKKQSFSVLWRYELQLSAQSPVEESRAITAPALCLDQRVFLASKNCLVLALNEEDGRKIWEFNAGQPISKPMFLAGENLFFSTEKEIFCLNRENGKLIWRKELEYEMTSPLTYFNIALYFAAKDNNFYCLNGENGELIWRFATASPIYSSPTIYRGILLVGDDEGHIYSLLSSNGKLLWKLKIGGRIRSSPFVSEGYLFIGSYDDYIYALNIKNRKIEWKVRTGADIQASAIGWKDYIFVASFDSYLYCLKRSNGHLHYKRALPARPYSAPLIIDDVMYIQTLSNQLIAIKPESGKELNSFNADSLITSPLSISTDKDKLLLGTNEGSLYALALKPEKKKPIPEEEVITEEEEEEEKEEEEKEEEKEEEAPEEKKKEEMAPEEKVEIPPEVIELAIPYEKELHQQCLEFFRQGNYAQAALNWADMIAKLPQNYFTIVIGLYCTSDSLETIYQKNGQGTILFFLPKPYEGKVCYKVCLGLFSSAKEAEKKREQLPEFFQQEKPIISQLNTLLQ